MFEELLIEVMEMIYLGVWIYSTIALLVMTDRFLFV